ncbi:S-methylmethionine-dependent homocysteine/selenocysteine methylase [Rubricella aquisinus]|uniref:S-methylmethionine-dependent homocysteine/selenocysteine methylase n=1 Tax=Rubricella aquisinus TaxID=2028108 RepID=A0A840WMA5_9RHOB|nr:S-methylmethionine-dependent homocysteine/selenocysteine methylase [Rubricella aquisinus]
MSITLLDGGMGQELVRRSSAAPTPLWATEALLHAPDLVAEVHADFFAAGAQIATTNTYAVHRDRLAPAGIEGRFEDLQRAACEIAVRVRDAHGSGLIAGGVGPLKGSYRPDLALPVAEAAYLFGEVAAIQADYVDVFLIETASSVLEAEGALTGLLPAGKPVWLSVSVGDADGTRLRSGEPVEAILPLVEAMGPAALLINCTRPEAVTQGVARLSGASVPLGAYANGFTRIDEAFLDTQATVDALSARTDLTPAAYADHAADWIALGASIIGGCCEVGPAHIAELKSRFGA